MKNIFKSLVIAIIAVVLGASGLISAPVYADEVDISGGVSGGVKAAGGDAHEGDTLFGNGGIFNDVVNFLLFLIGIISVIMIIYGGIQYALSAGESGKVTSAKNTILYAIVGLIVAILAFAIVNFVTSSFGNK